MGELTAVALGNGVQESWKFDVRGRLTSHAAGSAFNLSNLAYAPDGDVASANDNVNGNWNYGYDALDLLRFLVQPCVRHHRRG